MSGLSNEPDMNIKGQINHALDDIRKCLLRAAETDQDTGAAFNLSKARYTLAMADNMVVRYRQGLNTPWRDYRPMITEEFSQ